MPTGFVRDTSSEYPWIEKAATETLNYGFDWADPKDDWLGSATITSSTWAIATSPIAPGLQKSGTSFVLGKTSLWLSQGVIGRKYLVTNEVVTSDGRTGSRTFEIRIVKR